MGRSRELKRERARADEEAKTELGWNGRKCHDMMVMMNSLCTFFFSLSLYFSSLPVSTLLDLFARGFN